MKVVVTLRFSVEVLHVPSYMPCFPAFFLQPVLKNPFQSVLRHSGLMMDRVKFEAILGLQILLNVTMGNPILGLQYLVLTHLPYLRHFLILHQQLCSSGVLSHFDLRKVRYTTYTHIGIICPSKKNMFLVYRVCVCARLWTRHTVFSFYTSENILVIT